MTLQALQSMRRSMADVRRWNLWPKARKALLDALRCGRAQSLELILPNNIKGFL